MSSSLPFVVVGLIAVGLLLWRVVSQRRAHLGQKVTLEQLGFRPCPDEKSWLEETITRIENNREFSYEVRDPERLLGEPAVYHYVKMRHRYADEAAVAEEEILFPVKRPSAGWPCPDSQAFFAGTWDRHALDGRHCYRPVGCAARRSPSPRGPS